MHFCVLLNDTSDTVELLGDPKENNLDHFSPPIPKEFSISDFSTNRKYKSPEQARF